MLPLTQRHRTPRTTIAALVRGEWCCWTKNNHKYAHEICVFFKSFYSAWVERVTVMSVFCSRPWKSMESGEIRLPVWLPSCHSKLVDVHLIDSQPVKPLNPLLNVAKFLVFGPLLGVVRLSLLCILSIIAVLIVSTVRPPLVLTHSLKGWSDKALIPALLRAFDWCTLQPMARIALFLLGFHSIKTKWHTLRKGFAAHYFNPKSAE